MGIPGRVLSVVALLAVTAGALAADDDEPASGPSEMGQARQAIEAERYQEAIGLLEKVVARNERDADAYNLLGYSHRKSGDVEAAKRYYARALEIKPKHLGANEYLGELYLEQGQVDKAEERLKVIRKACFFGCEEYDELKAAIDDWRARNGG